MCGSPKQPDPAPDYSQQLAAFRQQQQSEYDSQANAYNEAANAFNENLANFGQQIAQGQSQFGNLTIADADGIDNAFNFWSGLRETANSPWSFTPSSASGSTGGGSPDLSGFNFGDATNLNGLPNNLGVQLGDFDVPDMVSDFNAPGAGTGTSSSGSPTTFSGLLGFNLEAPNFQSVVMSPFGGNTVQLNVPSLVNPNTSQASQYMSQIEQALNSLAALRNQRAEEQNRVSQFQTNYRGNLGDLEARLGNLTIADMTGMNSIEAELNRLENQRRGFTSALLPEYSDFFGQTSQEQDYQDILSGLSSLRDQRSAEQARIDAARNDWTSLFDNARNSLTNLSIADLDQINAINTQIDDAARNARRFSSVLTPDLSVPLDAYREADTLVEQLLSQRRAEESRVSNYEQSLLQRARSLENQARTMGITNPQAFEALMAQADALRQEASGFTSQINYDLSQELAPLDSATSRIQELQAQREAESGRVSDFQSYLANELAAIRGEANNLDISNLDAIRALDERLSALDNESRSFNADLPFDFSNLYSQYGEVDRSIADLYSARNAEELRVSNAERSAMDRANSILRSATLSDYYDGTGLQALMADIEAARNNASGFSSALGFDFSGALDALSQAESRVAELQGQRSESLADVLARASGIEGGLTGADLWDEAANRRARTDAQEALNQLAMFRGSDVADARSAFSNILGLVDDRAYELGDVRNELETRARDLRAELRNTTFYGEEDMAAKRAELQALEEEINQYRAVQAEDELSQLYGLFDAEGRRISNDAAAVEARTARERQEGWNQIASNRMEQFFQNLRTSPTSRLDYNELLRMMGGAGGSAPTAFSRSIGLS